MSLYDPSRVFPVEMTEHSPLGTFEHRDREREDADIAAPYRHGNALHHPRAAARQKLDRLIRTALKDLIGKWHAVPPGRVNTDALRDPIDVELERISERFNAHPHLAGAAQRIAVLRGYGAYLDSLDARDGISTRAPTTDGNAYPGASAELPARPGGTTTFKPVGFR